MPPPAFDFPLVPPFVYRLPITVGRNPARNPGPWQYDFPHYKRRHSVRMLLAEWLAADSFHAERSQESVEEIERLVILSQTTESDCFIDAHSRVSYIVKLKNHIVDIRNELRRRAPERMPSLVELSFRAVLRETNGHDLFSRSNSTDVVRELIHFVFFHELSS